MNLLPSPFPGPEWTAAFGRMVRLVGVELGRELVADGPNPCLMSLSSLSLEDMMFVSLILRSGKLGGYGQVTKQQAVVEKTGAAKKVFTQSQS